jgi:hypothetical protein
VILASVLKHDINIGCKMRPRVLKDVNGEAILGLVHLARVASALEDTTKKTKAAAKGEFIRITFRNDENSGSSGDGSDDDENDDEDDDSPQHSLPSVVLEREKLSEANAEICKAHAISGTISTTLLEGQGSSSSSSSSSGGGGGGGKRRK